MINHYENYTSNKKNKWKLQTLVKVTKKVFTIKNNYKININIKLILKFYQIHKRKC